MPNESYLALTIGPIYNTLTALRSTKAIWAGSYLFSHLMKSILSKIADRDSLQILMPYIGEIEVEGKKIDLLNKAYTQDAGLFPDRFIASSSNLEEDYQVLLTAIETVKKDLAKLIAENLQNKKGRKDAPDAYDKALIDEIRIKLFIDDYFQFHPVKLSFSEDDLGESNAIFLISSILDSAELKLSFPSQLNINYLQHFLEDIFYNTFIEEAFGKNYFPSTIEVATQEFKKGNKHGSYQHTVDTILVRQDNADAQNKFLGELKKQDFPLKQFHKYITVVQADGDNIGALIKKIFAINPNLFSDFSKQLLIFAYKATQLIKDKGGLPVYIGGDDLLYFSPVASNSTDGQTIFQTIQDIDNLFKNTILAYSSFKDIFKQMGEKKPSMSYGVMTAYYKHPLSETLSSSAGQLFQIAKQTEYKNAVSFSLEKHSGQMFGGTLFKDDNTENAYHKFLALQNKRLTAEEGEKFFNSLIFKLKSQQSIVNEIFNQNEAGKHLEHFFDNNFNEDIHNRNKDKLQLIREFMFVYYTDYKYQYKKNSGGIDREKQMTHFYGLLRFAQFLSTQYKND